VVAAVEAATGVTATNLGKPAAQPFWTALERLGVPRAPAPAPPPSAAARLAAPPVTTAADDDDDDDGERTAGDGPPGAARVLVVGDRLDSDLAGAHAAGLDAAIVLTGATTEDEALVAHDPTPVAVATSLAALVLGEG
jgi:ribonucleotide monophosphatase NagD (HAD superfamily)